MTSRELASHGSGGLMLSSRDERKVGRELSRAAKSAALEMVDVRRVEAVETAKVEALAMTARIATAEAEILVDQATRAVRRNPASAPYVEHLVDIAVSEMGGRLYRMNRRLG
jgi:hypothetical protein